MGSIIKNGILNEGELGCVFYTCSFNNVGAEVFNEAFRHELQKWSNQSYKV